MVAAGEHIEESAVGAASPRSASFFFLFMAVSHSSTFSLCLTRTHAHMVGNSHAHTLAKEKNKSFAETLSFGSHKCYIFSLLIDSTKRDYTA